MTHFYDTHFLFTQLQSRRVIRRMNEAAQTGERAYALGI